MTVSDYVLERLRDWDVEYVFACPGDGINGLAQHVTPPPASTATTCPTSPA